MAVGDKAPPRRVSILVFDEVEVLDFAGPFEIFSVAGQREGSGLFRVATVSSGGETITARNGLRVVPDHSFATAGPTDVLVVPGGYGTRPLVHDDSAIEWIRRTADGCELVVSVCTGALLLAAAGLLRGRPATTHHLAIDRLVELEPQVDLRRERVAASEGMIVAAGISAGLDASLDAVKLLCGIDRARETARYMEYDWAPSDERARGGGG